MELRTILGEEFAIRYQNSTFTIGDPESVLDGTGQLIKGHFLTPTTKLDYQDALDAVVKVDAVARKELDWNLAQPIAHAVISIPSGYRLLTSYSRECPIEQLDMMHWRDGGDAIVPPRPCTRERKILSNLEEEYMNIVTTRDKKFALRKYAAIDAHITKGNIKISSAPVKPLI